MLPLQPLSPRRAAARDRRFQRMAGALAGLRILAGVIWLAAALKRLPPDFEVDGGHGLRHWLEVGAVNGIQPAAWLARHPLLDHVTATAWLLFGLEVVAGGLLLVGWRTTLGAILGTVLALGIALLLAPAPDAWGWGYALLVAVNAAPLFGPANLRFSVDVAIDRA
jgi:hypothetical protein